MRLSLLFRSVPRLPAWLALTALLLFLVGGCEYFRPTTLDPYHGTGWTPDHGATWSPGSFENAQ